MQYSVSARALVWTVETSRRDLLEHIVVDQMETPKKLYPCSDPSTAEHDSTWRKVFTDAVKHLDEVILTYLGEKVF